MSIVSRSPVRALFALPLIAGFAAIAPATAQSPDTDVVVTSTVHAGQNLTMRSIPVAFGDLNLADGSDFARLHRRVQTAADQACADTGVWTAMNDLDYARCYKSAVSIAMAHVMSRATITSAASN